jgi:hypothetical protein
MKVVRTQSAIVAWSKDGWEEQDWDGAAGAEILRDIIEGQSWTKQPSPSVVSTSRTVVWSGRESNACRAHKVE